VYRRIGKKVPGKKRSEETNQDEPRRVAVAGQGGVWGKIRSRGGGPKYTVASEPTGKRQEEIPRLERGPKSVDSSKRKRNRARARKGARVGGRTSRTQNGSRPEVNRQPQERGEKVR